MGLRLSVRREPWVRAIESVAAAVPALVPVVKGNGYGFGRETLMPFAAGLGGTIAVGSVYEVADVPVDRVAMVLTPHLGVIPGSVPATSVLTVGHSAHIAALHRSGWTGAVALKLRSRMRRYGVEAGDVASASSEATDAGMRVTRYAIHLDLAGTDNEHVDEISAWLADLDPALPLSISHLGPAAYAQLCGTHPDRRFEIRLGTALWHADKTLMQLTADALDVRAIMADEPTGYRATPAPADGHLVLVAAGSGHGVSALADGRSPFHFARQRLPMLEAPHMHTSMVFVPEGAICPEIGDRIDVQRPLITTSVDEVEWL